MMMMMMELKEREKSNTPVGLRRLFLELFRDSKHLQILTLEHDAVGNYYYYYYHHHHHQ